MHMSIRLIKHDQPGHPSVVSLFTFPGSGEFQAQATTLDMPFLDAQSTSVFDDPDDGVQHRLDVDRQLRDDAARLRQEEVAAEVARLTEPIYEQYKQGFAELAALRKTMALRAERELVRLAIEIARKIVNREVTTDNDVVMTLTRMALSRLQNRTVARVHLHPDDFVYVNAHLVTLESNHAIELTSNSSIGRGGCLVQTELGDVDARVEQQFAEIERSLMET
jgi:hypothetical protein